MSVCGVVCEYNPFHLGHEKQLRLIREQLGSETVIVALMSGNFVQRAEPAVFDKLTRAQAAVQCGADLVLELPVTCALRSAEGFAHGAVALLNALGCVDTLSFGCECGSKQTLFEAARAMQQPEFDALLRSFLQTGSSYAAAKSAALTQLGLDASVAGRPNDILALEYCRALLKLQSPMQVLAVQREGDYHAPTPQAENPSATAVRQLLLARQDASGFVPQQAAQLYRDATRYAPEYGTRAVLARLRGLSRDEWQTCAHDSEGLWSKAQKEADRCMTLDALYDALKSKRYPRTRLQRLILCAYLGISQQVLAAQPPYLRVLAFDDAGRALLHRMKKTATIPLVNAGQTPPDAAYFALERRTTLLHALFCDPQTKTAPLTEEEYRIFQKKP